MRRWIEENKWVYVVITMCITPFVSLLLPRSTPVNTYVPSSRVVISADHIEYMKGYTKVWSDADTDYSVWVINDYHAVAPPNGSELYFNEKRGTLISATDMTFVMKPDNVLDIYPGVSGTPILYESTPIGFISGWNGDGNVLCIFY